MGTEGLLDVDELAQQIRFGRMAVALGYLDAERLAEAMYRLGTGEAGSLAELLLAAGWVDAEQMASIERKLDGEPPGELLLRERMEIRDEIGHGAHGTVIRARDGRLGRTVALKALRPEVHDRSDIVARFLLEAQLAGQLTHPNIVPVYDLGALPGIGLCYAMKEVKGRSLHQVLAALRTGELDTEEQYPLTQLVRILRRVCDAVAFAHAQGVIHRDIKPHNVMVGPFGEVLLADWGSAKIVGISEDDDSGTLDEEVLEDTTSSLSTRAGKIKGTPAYMSPEQARADNDEVGPLTDVYALGAMLYELLCLRPPFSGDAIGIVLEEVKNEMPLTPSSHAPGRGIPADLEELAMQALSKEPAERPASVQALAVELDEFLDGTRRRRHAQSALRDAEAALERFEDLVGETEQAQREAGLARNKVAPWAPPEQKRTLWALDRRTLDLRRRREEAFNLALGCYQRALGSDPNNIEAREGLADLYWRKFEEAETRGDEENTEFFRSQVLLQDTGRYRHEFSGMATMSVRTDPPGAEATLYRCEEQDLVLVPSLPRQLGPTPTETVKMAQGSYIVRLQLQGHTDVNLALFSSRPGARSYHVRMWRDEEVGEGFVHVPGGQFLRGGDPRVPESWPRRPKWLPDFAIARHPVTLGQYMQFLEFLAHEEGRDAALARAPRMDARGRRRIRWDPRRETVVLVARPEPGPDAMSRPVTSISWGDAQAYARWRSHDEGRELRLPTEMEWEKAARGVDGRLYPWGDEFEPTYCNCRNAMQEGVGLQPVGSYPRDVSVYGVADVAGGVMEWCADGEHPQVRRARGGAWNRTGRECTVVGAISLPPWITGTAIGMRLAAPLLGTSQGGS